MKGVPDFSDSSDDENGILASKLNDMVYIFS